MPSTKEITKDFDGFLDELEKAEKTHDEYLRIHRDVLKRQLDCATAVKHLKYSYLRICNDIKRIEQKGTLPEEEKDALKAIRARYKEINTKLVVMERELPAVSNGWYLSIILGSNLSVSLLSSDERYRYKKEYESFKATVTSIILAMFSVAYFIPYRPMDALCNFLLVWYYCTLTIRESILRVNGSRIKGWWVFHHYVSCVLCGINLTWTMSNSECYEKVRPIFVLLVLYVGSVQFLQWKYQIGCLRRLHALGHRHTMDITLEGFTSWMFKGLTFLLPFLIFGYIIQGYCAYTLVDLYLNGCSKDWQVPTLAFLFAFIALGNISTTALIVFRKIFDLNSDTVKSLTLKYREKSL